MLLPAIQFRCCAKKKSAQKKRIRSAAYDDYGGSDIVYEGPIIAPNHYLYDQIGYLPVVFPKATTTTTTTAAPETNGAGAGVAGAGAGADPVEVVEEVPLEAPAEPPAGEDPNSN